MTAPSAAHLEVVTAEGLVSVQDLGRPRRRADTVPLAGAADQAAHKLANRLVGNVESAATLECAFASLRLAVPLSRYPPGMVTVAVCGPGCFVSVESAAMPTRRGGTSVALTLRPGEELVVGRPTSGVRTYVAVRGGVDVPPTLGSRSWDSLSRLGPQPLAAGDRLSIGDLVDPDAAPLRETGGTPTRRYDEIRLDRGPHLDLLDASARRRLGSATMTVGARADRVAVQLDDVLAPGLTADLPSFPVLPGSLQIPPDGRPLLLGRDCGVTGGYPVVGVVPIAALDLVGQLRPGDRFRFRTIGW